MDIHYKISLSEPIDIVIANLKESLQLEKFGVLWELNFKDKLREKGLEFNKDFIIFEVCNPPQAKRVLDENMDAGYFLPCKIAVYEENETIVVGMLKPTMLIGMMENTSLHSIANEVEISLKKAIDRLASTK